MKFQYFRFYSILKLFTGFATAAFIDCKQTVINAIAIAINPGNASIHHSIFIRYAKSSSQVFIANQATGMAMIVAMATNCIKFLPNIIVTEATEAPNTFLIPISFTRCAVVKITRPSKPRQAITKAKMVNTRDSCSCFCSAEYCFLKFSSKNWKSAVLLGSNFE